MGAALRLSRPHGQDRLRMIQRLNLRFLVNTQHQRFIWGIPVKSNNVSDLINKQWVFGKFEVLVTVWGQSESAPNSMEAAPARAASCGQRARALVRRILRRRFQGHRQHSFDFHITESARRFGSRLAKQTVEPLMQKARPPFCQPSVGDAGAAPPKYYFSPRHTPE